MCLDVLKISSNVKYMPPTGDLVGMRVPDTDVEMRDISVIGPLQELLNREVSFSAVVDSRGKQQATVGFAYVNEGAQPVLFLCGGIPLMLLHICLISLVSLGHL